MEECVLIDGDILNEIIIPTTNVDRLLPDGTRHKEEIINKSQIYITTAGWKNSFAKPKKFVGEVKPHEPQNEGVIEILLTLKAKIRNGVPSCLAEGSETIENTYFYMEMSRVGLR